MPLTYGAFIRYKRRQSGLTAAQVAAAIAPSEGWLDQRRGADLLYRKERGEIPISLEEWFSLAGCFGMTYGEFTQEYEAWQSQGKE